MAPRSAPRARATRTDPARIRSSPRAAALHFIDATHVRVGGRNLLYFGGSDYLGLARHAHVLRAMRHALVSGFTQPGASRATTGEHRLYLEAELELARFFRQPAAAVLPCGYLAPLAAVQTLHPYITHVLLEPSAHACLRDAATASGRPIHPLPLGSVAARRRSLRSLGRRARPLLLVEGVTGTSGAVASLPDYLALLPAGGWLLVDDAHGAGTLGPGGRGTLAFFQIQDPRILQTISLAKSFGVAGGAVLGPADILTELRTRAAAFVGTTAMPLASVAGVRAAVRVLRTHPERVQRLQAKAAALHALLPDHPCLSKSPWTPVTAVIPPSTTACRHLQRTLLTAGIYPSRIHYLNAPATGFFRWALNVHHTTDDIRRLAAAVTTGLRFQPAAHPDASA